MPCALVEGGFLTHRVEGQRLSTRRYQKDIARGIADGILGYLAAASSTSNL